MLWPELFLLLFELVLTRHQDKEEDIVKHSTIAAVSLGAARRFCLRHDKTKHIHQVRLSFLLSPMIASTEG